MPLQQAPTPIYPADIEAAPFRFSPDPLSDEMALAVCQQTFYYFEQWRAQNCDSRWKANEQLYYGRVEQRFWEGSKVARSSVAMRQAAQAVDAAHAKISQEIIEQPDVLQVTPEFGASGEHARLVQHRLEHILDHNIDDYGWTMRMEASLALKDVLIYGNCYGLVEYDHARRQGTLIRLDPRDVYIDPACWSPYTEAARASIVRRVVTISDVVKWRKVKGFNVPSNDELFYFARNRRTLMKDAYTAIGARGERYTPAQDMYVADPSLQNINLFIHFSRGREIWTIDNQWILYNEAFPYGCSRLVSAPCITVPNRHYAESLVDRSETVQQVSTTLLNWHVDEVSLMMNPPRSQSSRVVGTPGQNVWRPNAVFQTGDAQKDIAIHMPTGVTANVWQTLGFLDQENQKSTGINTLAIAGMPTPSNANRTAGGINQQLGGSDGRLAPIAANFENYFMIPAFHKILKIEAVHADSDQYHGY